MSPVLLVVSSKLAKISKFETPDVRCLRKPPEPLNPDQWEWIRAATFVGNFDWEKLFLKKMFAI